MWPSKFWCIILIFVIQLKQKPCQNYNIRCHRPVWNYPYSVQLQQKSSSLAVNCDSYSAEYTCTGSASGECKQRWRRPSGAVKFRENCSFYGLLLLAISGDIQLNPGPSSGKGTPKHPCVLCHKSVRANSKAVACDLCDRWSHIACCDIPKDVYDAAVRHKTDISFVCSGCMLHSLPQYEASTTSEHCDSGSSNNSTEAHLTWWTYTCLPVGAWTNRKVERSSLPSYQQQEFIA